MVYRWDMKRFFHVHGCTLSSWPVEFTPPSGLNRSTSQIRLLVHSIILVHLTVIYCLYNITIPALVINWAKDFVQDFVIQPFLEKKPTSPITNFGVLTTSPSLEKGRALWRSPIVSCLDLPPPFCLPSFSVISCTFLVTRGWQRFHFLIAIYPLLVFMDPLAQCNAFSDLRSARDYAPSG